MSLVMKCALLQCHVVCL